MNPDIEHINEVNNAGEDIKAKNKAKIRKKREEAKYNPDEIYTNDAKTSTSSKRFKSAPKPLVGYITGREQHDSMVKHLQQKPVVSIDTYNFRMVDIYDKIGKTLTDKSTQDEITKICNFNNYMRRVDVELVYDDE